MHLLRLCDAHNIPFATNIATGEVLIHGLERGDLEWRNLLKNPECNHLLDNKRVLLALLAKTLFIIDIFTINFRHKFSIHLQNCSICSLFYFYILSIQKIYAIF